MLASRVNQGSGRILAALALIALGTVSTGYFVPPLPDEGTAAHLFQLSVVMAVVAGAVYLATADWRQPWRSARALILPGVLLLAAFAALYYLEHFYYPAHFR